MKQSTKRFVSMVLSLMLIAAAFVIFFNFIKPAYQEAQGVRSEQISRQEFVDSQKSAIQQAQGLIQDYQGQRQLQEQVSYVLPLSPDISGALIQLNGLALVSGLRPEAFSVTPPSTANAANAAALARGTGAGATAQDALTKPMASIDFQVRFTSSYESFKTFLTQLETNIRVFDVKAINLAPSGKAGTYSFDLTVTAYYQTL